MPPNKLNGGASEVNGRCLEAPLERLRDAVAFVDRSGWSLLTNRVALSAAPPSVHVAELGEPLQSSVLTASRIRRRSGPFYERPGQAR